MFANINLFAQQYTFGIKLTGLSIHPGGAQNAHIMKYKIDEKGVFVFNPGIRLSFEYFIYKDIVSIKFDQGFYRDCANQFAGFSHIGIRGRIFQIGNHSLNGGIGPTFFFRRNWYKIDGYIEDDDFFRGGPNDNWQRRFFWWGGEFEYNYRINERIEFSTSLIPIIPPIIPGSIHLGIRILNN